MLFVGLQFVVWSVSGAYMVLVDLDYIHGDTLVTKQANNLNGKTINYPLSELLKKYPLATNIKVEVMLDQAVYRFSQDKKSFVLSADSGQLLSPIDEATALSIAQHSYVNNKVKVSSISLLTDHAPRELSSRYLPVWRVDFEDFASPTFYISANNGRLVTKRHNFWRLFDWLFAFHVMDYIGEEADNKLLFIFTVIALVASLFGIVLTYFRLFKMRSKNKVRIKSHTLFKLSTVKQLHKWLSLIVFAQLIIWIGSGLFFNLIDHGKTRGNQYLVSTGPNKLMANELVGIQLALIRAQGKLNAIDKVILIHLDTGPFYLFSGEGSQSVLINANNGQIKTIDQPTALSLAQMSYKGNAQVKSIKQVKPPIDDFPKYKSPLWQINFLDEVNTSAYVNRQTGKMIGHSNDDKRFADFFFMLHFMDYPFLGEGSTGGFNNWQIMFFAIITLLFCLTGFIWTVELIINGRYRLK